MWEGDIMPNSENEIMRNGLMDETMRWPGGVVPFYIQEEDFGMRNDKYLTHLSQPTTFGAN